MKPRVWISEATFSDGTTLTFGKDEIIVFVGPNNVGKSAALKELYRLLRHKTQAGKVIQTMQVDKEGSSEDCIEYIRTTSIAEITTNPHPTYSGLGFSIYGSQIEGNWNNINGLGELAPLFSNLLDTEQRLAAAKPATNIALTTQAPQHPIHYLQRDDSVEARFSGYFRMAFDMDMIVHRNAGNEVPLYVGTRPELQSGEDRVSINYIRQLEMLAKLHEQGDGMRSFVGVLLNAFVGFHSMLFIDEPEAFLHPPQARLLGKMLAKDLPPGKQVFLSTHSIDFIRGLLDAGASNLKIVRIGRAGNVNTPSELNSSEIESIWNDPLLRYSEILQGLFHLQVVVCESDSDCRFYAAVLDAEVERRGAAIPDVMFTHCGGKQRVAMVVKALKKLNVPVIAICDFDVLNAEEPLKSIVDELGGAWDDIKSEWACVKKEIEQKRPELNTDDVQKAIGKILGDVSTPSLSDKNLKELKDILKKASPWAEAKTGGINYVPSGNANAACKKILEYCKDKGLLIVEIGQLESFVRSVGNHGPKWVNDVLGKDLKSDPELEDARKFIWQVIK